MALAAVLALAAPALQLNSVAPAEAVTLPSGFTLVDYASGQPPYNLTNFAWLDDGGLLTSGKDGKITFVPPGGSPREIAQVPNVRAVGDHGLLGFAPANDYATTGHVYVTYDKGDPAGTGFGMVEQWTAAPPAAPTTFTWTRTLIDGSAKSIKLAERTHVHAIDSVVVAPDDSLFVSIGDDANNNGDPNTLRAQDTSRPYGKLLRITPTGKGHPSNPFYNTSATKSWGSMVYAYGLRNPFRFSLDPRSGIVHLGDVGWRSTEEVNTLLPGANAGWPCYEGTQKTTFSSYDACKQLYAAGSARMPISTYPHDGTGGSVVGGVHYVGTAYPPAYTDSYFFGDYSQQRIWTLQTDNAGKLVRAPEAAGFAVDAGAPVAFQTGPNGDVTYADLVTGNVRRLVYTEGNRAPVARLTTDTDATTRTVTFSAGESYDLDGDQLTYDWTFGDGATATGASVTHTYGARVDNAVATLTVTDELGASDSVTATVYPSNFTPQLDVQAPAASLTYAVGDDVQLSAAAVDEEDGILSVSWDTALLHCPVAGSCHLHPDGSVVSQSYTSPFTDHGADTTMLVTARATDSLGATTTSTYEALPTLRTLSVNSPVAVNINGETTASTQVVAGSTAQLVAPATSSFWTFVAWSDGGAGSHALTMPDADLVLTARYRTAIDAKYVALGGASSFLKSPTSLEYDVTGGRARNYSGGRLYWRSALGAHEVHGRILTKYASLGYQTSCLGLPRTDQYKTSGGLRNRFQHGRITYHYDDGSTTYRCR